MIFEWLGLGLGLAALIGWFLVKRKRIEDAPSDEIPTQDEMVRLKKRVLAGDKEATRYWFRGAVYYESQKLHGFSAREALEVALDPELNQIDFEVKVINA